MSDQLSAFSQSCYHAECALRHTWKAGSALIVSPLFPLLVILGWSIAALLVFTP